MATLGSPHIRRLLGVAAASTILLLVGAAAAVAEIVPQKGIAGAKLGQTQTQIVDKLGKPDRIRTKTNPFSGGDFEEFKYDRTWVSFDGTKKSSEVWGVSTKDPDERTETGVGVGSTKAEVKDGVKNVTCAKEFGVNHCYVGDFEPFTTVTDFRLKKKKGEPAHVKSVTVGIVLD